MALTQGRAGGARRLARGRRLLTARKAATCGPGGEWALGDARPCLEHCVNGVVGLCAADTRLVYPARSMEGGAHDSTSYASGGSRRGCAATAARHGLVPPPLDYRNVMVSSHAPMPLGAKTADEVLASQTPTICNLPAHLAVRGLAVLVLAWNAVSLALLETTELGRAMSYLSLGVYTVGLVASFTSFSAPKVAQGFYFLVAIELFAVLGVDIFKISRVVSAESAAAEAHNGAASGGDMGSDGGGGDGAAEEKEAVPNLTLAVFSLLVNVILHFGCLFCAR